MPLKWAIEPRVELLAGCPRPSRLRRELAKEAIVAFETFHSFGCWPVLAGRRLVSNRLVVGVGVEVVTRGCNRGDTLFCMMNKDQKLQWLLISTTIVNCFSLTSRQRDPLSHLRARVAQAKRPINRCSIKSQGRASPNSFLRGLSLALACPTRCTCELGGWSYLLLSVVEPGREHKPFRIEAPLHHLLAVESIVLRNPEK